MIMDPTPTNRFDRIYVCFKSFVTNFKDRFKVFTPSIKKNDLIRSPAYEWHTMTPKWLLKSSSKVNVAILIILILHVWGFAFWTEDRDKRGEFLLWRKNTLSKTVLRFIVDMNFIRFGKRSFWVAVLYFVYPYQLSCEIGFCKIQIRHKIPHYLYYIRITSINFGCSIMKSTITWEWLFIMPTITRPITHA